MPFHCRLGEIVQDFHCETTHGNFTFYEYLRSDPDRPWTLLFSHPADFTPVCTTEIGRSEKLLPRFNKLGVKLIGISCDSVDDHHLWAKDILFNEGIKSDMLSFPIIADHDRKIVQQLGMLGPQDTSQMQTMPLPVRAVFVVDTKAVLRLAVIYPAVVGRSYEEILRAITALNLTEKFSVATPVEWIPDQDVLLTPDASKEQAVRLGPVQSIQLPSGKDYFKFVPCPTLSSGRPSRE